MQINSANGEEFRREQESAKSLEKQTSARPNVTQTCSNVRPKYSEIGIRLISS